jgi:hypothetical protein
MEGVQNTVQRPKLKFFRFESHMPVPVPTAYLPPAPCAIAAANSSVSRNSTKAGVDALYAMAEILSRNAHPISQSKILPLSDEPTPTAEPPNRKNNDSWNSMLAAFND